jgi:hypothetical protein
LQPHPKNASLRDLGSFATAPDPIGFRLHERNIDPGSSIAARVDFLAGIRIRLAKEQR